METFIMESQKAIIYLDKIDEAYRKGKAEGWSRFGDEWTDFSTPMNKEVRKKIVDEVPEAPLLNVVLPYWFNRSEMLEIHFKKKTRIKKGTLKRLKKQCAEFRQDIENSRIDKYGTLSMLDVARMSIQGAR